LLVPGRFLNVLVVLIRSFYSLACLAAFSTLQVSAQPDNLSFDSAQSGLQLLLDQMDPTETRTFSAIDMNASGLGELKRMTDATGDILILSNHQPAETGGYLTKTYFIEESDELFATRTQQEVVYTDGQIEFSDEIELFNNGELSATVGRRGDFRGDRAEADFQEYATLSSEIESFAAPEIYQANLREARQIAGLVKALAGKAAEDLESPLLLRTISPNGRYIVSWEETGPEADDVTFSLLDLEAETIVTTINEGRRPGENHVYHTAYWSADSERLAFVSDAKWNTVSAPLISIDPASGEAASLGNLHEAAVGYTLQQLKALAHPYLDQHESIDGFIRVLALLPDGRVHLLLDAQSKSEDPLANIRCEMTLQFVGNEPVKGAGFQVLDPESPIGQPVEMGINAADEGESVEWLMTARQVGPLEAGAEFDLVSIRALFPEQRVVATTEFFEEGGERPVLQVMEGDEVLLMIVPRPGTREISWISTSHPHLQTQLGIHAGQRFGDIFESIPEDAAFEGMTGDVLTSAAGLSNVTFRFLPQDPASDSSTELPPYDRLADWKLHTIEWTPPTE